jgi:hypothetical protein
MEMQSETQLLSYPRVTITKQAIKNAEKNAERATHTLLAGI